MLVLGLRRNLDIVARFYLHCWVELWSKWICSPTRRLMLGICRPDSKEQSAQLRLRTHLMILWVLESCIMLGFHSDGSDPYAP